MSRKPVALIERDGMFYKKCAKCGEEKLVSEFHSAKSKCGYNSYCIECQRQYCNESSRKLLKSRPMHPFMEDGKEYKKCNECKQVKPIQEFKNIYYVTNRCIGICNDCSTPRLKKSTYEPKNKDGLKRCVGKEGERWCGEWLPATTDFFYVCRSSPDGLYNRCINCVDKAIQGNIAMDNYNENYIKQPNRYNVK